MVRPEQLEVRPRGEGCRTDRRTGGGRVEECRYYGHDALLQIRPEEPAREQVLLARVHGERALPAGTPVTLAATGRSRVV